MGCTLWHRACKYAHICADGLCGLGRSFDDGGVLAGPCTSLLTALTARNLQDHPLLRFKYHALEHADTLLLAAQVGERPAGFSALTYPFV